MTDDDCGGAKLTTRISSGNSSFVVALLANLALAAFSWLAVDALTNGVDYNIGLWAVPVLCLLAVTAGLGVMALLDRSWRRSGIGILLAVPVVVIADVLWLLIHVVEATQGS